MSAFRGKIKTKHKMFADCCVGGNPAVGCRAIPSGGINTQSDLRFCSDLTRGELRYYLN